MYAFFKNQLQGWFSFLTICALPVFLMGTLGLSVTILIPLFYTEMLLSGLTTLVSKELVFFMYRVKSLGKLGQAENRSSYIKEDAELNALVKEYDLFDSVKKTLTENASKMGESIPLKGIELGIIKTSNPNAFATGPSLYHSGIAVTSGLLDLFKRKSPSMAKAKERLNAVISHEIGHILKGHIAFKSIMVLVQALFQTASYIANRYKEYGTSPLLVTWIYKTQNFIVGLLGSSFSRTCESAADETAVDCGRGEALIEALEILEEASSPAFSKKSSGFTPSFSSCCHFDTSLSSATTKPSPKTGFLPHFERATESLLYWSRRLFGTHPTLDMRSQHIRQYMNMSKKAA